MLKRRERERKGGREREREKGSEGGGERGKERERELGKCKKHFLSSIFANGKFSHANAKT